VLLRRRVEVGLWWTPIHYDMREGNVRGGTFMSDRIDVFESALRAVREIITAG